MKKVMSLLLAVALVLGCCAFGVLAQSGKAKVEIAAITWGGAEQPKPEAKVVFSVQLKN